MAMKQLESEGLTPKFLQLDITSSESIEAAKAYLLANYGHLDVLINNAGVCLTVQCSHNLSCLLCTCSRVLETHTVIVNVWSLYTTCYSIEYYGHSIS